MRRLSLLALLAAIVSTAAGARAEDEARGEKNWGFHAAYGLGSGWGDPSGFRSGFDLFGGLGRATSNGGNRDGMGSKSSGWLVGGSAVVGIGKAPVYAIPEIATTSDNMFTASSAAIGPAVRLTDGLGGGVSARLAFDVILVQVGVRAIVMVAPRSDGQVTFTIGCGRF